MSEPIPEKPRRMSIDELQKLLERDDDITLEILPNGEIREAGSKEKTDRKPLTMRDNLGGEYADAPGWDANGSPV
jgi:hypothetical protein